MEADDLFGVPEHLCKICDFSQLRMPHDLHLSKSRKKVWRTIKNYRDKFLPNLKEEGEQMVNEIKKYQETSELAKTLYSSNLIYKPSEAIM